MVAVVMNYAEAAVAAATRVVEAYAPAELIRVVGELVK